jgi:hypothetical protein
VYVSVSTLFSAFCHFLFALASVSPRRDEPPRCAAALKVGDVLKVGVLKVGAEGRARGVPP